MKRFVSVCLLLLLSVGLLAQWMPRVEATSSEYLSFLADYEKYFDNHFNMTDMKLYHNATYAEEEENTKERWGVAIAMLIFAFAYDKTGDYRWMAKSQWLADSMVPFLTTTSGTEGSVDIGYGSPTAYWMYSDVAYYLTLLKIYEATGVTSYKTKTLTFITTLIDNADLNNSTDLFWGYNWNLAFDHAHGIVNVGAQALILFGYATEKGYSNRTTEMQKIYHYVEYARLGTGLYEYSIGDGAPNEDYTIDVLHAYLDAYKSVPEIFNTANIQQTLNAISVTSHIWNILSNGERADIYFILNSIGSPFTIPKSFKMFAEAYINETAREVFGHLWDTNSISYGRIGFMMDGAALWGMSHNNQLILPSMSWYEDSGYYYGDDKKLISDYLRVGAIATWSGESSWLVKFRWQNSWTYYDPLNIVNENASSNRYWKTWFSIGGKTYNSYRHFYESLWTLNASAADLLRLDWVGRTGTSSIKLYNSTGESVELTTRSDGTLHTTSSFAIYYNMTYGGYFFTKMLLFYADNSTWSFIRTPDPFEFVMDTTATEGSIAFFYPQNNVYQSIVDLFVDACALLPMEKQKNLTPAFSELLSTKSESLVLFTSADSLSGYNDEITSKNRLSFNLTKLSGTSATKVYVGEKGEPTSVSGASSWSYDDDTKILTVSVTHSSSEIITITWGESEIVGGGKFKLTIYVTDNFVPVLDAVVSIQNVNQTTVNLGRAYYELEYGTYDVVVYYHGQKQVMTLLLNQDRLLPINFSSKSSAPQTILGIPLLFLSIIFLSFLLIRKRRK